MATGLTIEIRAEAAEAALARIGQGLTPEPLLKLIGQRHLAWINENFRAGGAETRWVPLAPNTRAARRGGGAPPLRDTGRLAQSFTSAVAGDMVRVGTADRRAAWHHAGTRPYLIRPVQARALRFLTTGGVRFARQVQHPGLPARPLLPSDGLARALALGVLDAYLTRLLADAERGRGPAA